MFHPIPPQTLPQRSSSLRCIRSSSGSQSLSVIAGAAQGASKRPAPLPAEQQHVRWSDARRANAMSRDFTVNALMLDPFGLLVHDYTGGVRDCAKRVLRTIGSPAESFQLDPARMLRAVRHAARCGEGRCTVAQCFTTAWVAADF